MPRKTDADTAAEKAAGDLPERIEKENEQGFVGTKVDPIPNERYSLESGPDSPTTVEVREAVAKAEAEG